MNADHAARLASLTTAHLADACIRADVPVRCAPAGTRPLAAGTRVAGRVLPARHAGSVDVFLEAFEHAREGDVLVVDNGGRLDESCVGDLITLEAQAAGLAGMVIWGLHRDTVELRRIGLPVFSLGRIPTGPLDAALHRRGEAGPQSTRPSQLGEWTVDDGDVVFGDDDGVLVVPADRLEDVLGHAERIRDTEVAQGERIRGGRTLRDQVRLRDYLARRAEDPDLTFRRHLREVGGEIEV